MRKVRGARVSYLYAELLPHFDNLDEGQLGEISVACRDSSLNGLSG
jgi:hypothetical protein